ncbi:hypothetical protein PR003_g34653 [Phytophthora rubi]|uniref:Uncharacterized protein n=2 Tax=Phytophthora TaxID=4783 RepID=A0A6A4AQM2_9STRA|nr:hypothetical protein PF011_g31911 [Phytophthora fragariae]KAE9259748.1 hypothetical protein PR003_g34653 [Phytophthora rubi]
MRARAGELLLHCLVAVGCPSVSHSRVDRQLLADVSATRHTVVALFSTNPGR